MFYRPLGQADCVLDRLGLTASVGNNDIAVYPQKTGTAIFAVVDFFNPGIEPYQV